MTATTARTLVAREYLRVSADKSGKLKSLADQHTDHEDLAAERGWLLGTPYAETGAASASRYGRKTRPGFESLTADLESGTFGADILLLWESSRGSRKTWEWVRLIEALADASVLVYVAADERMYDPANARDRKSLRDSASDAEFESDKISKRVNRGMRASAQAGRPHGQPPYGYGREHKINGDGERVIRQVPVPAEADIVRGIFTDLAGGHSLRAIVARLNAGRVPTRAGTPWNTTLVRSIATNPQMIGMRLHLAGSKGGRRPRFGPADLIQGTWPAIVEPDLFWRVYATLTDPARRISRPGRGKHLASMIAVCGVCGGPLAVRYMLNRKAEPDYWCRNGSHVRVDQAEVDAALTGLVLAFLADRDRYARFAAADTSGELREARNALAEAQAAHDDLAANLAAGKLSATLAAKTEPAILARLDAAAKRVAELETPSGLRDLIGDPGGDVAARWDAAPMTARRSVLRLLFSRIAVERAPRPGPGVHAVERLTVEWRH